jgi:hypothetical protein
MFVFERDGSLENACALGLTIWSKGEGTVSGKERVWGTLKGMCAFI